MNQSVTLTFDEAQLQRLERIGRDHGLDVSQLLYKAAQLLDPADMGGWTAEDVAAVDEGLAQAKNGDLIAHEDVAWAAKALNSNAGSD